MSSPAGPLDKAAAFSPATSALTVKSPLKDEKTQRDGRDAYASPDDFAWSFFQAENAGVPMALPSGGFHPARSAHTDSSPDNVTMSQWQSLQGALVGSMTSGGMPPFSFSLQLPQWGDIDVTLAALPPQGWDIALRFSHETHQRLKLRRKACHRALSAALGCPVRLSFASREARS